MLGNPQLLLKVPSNQALQQAKQHQMLGNNPGTSYLEEEDHLSQRLGRAQQEIRGGFLEPWTLRLKV